MVNAKRFQDKLRSYGFDFFTGVPDSCLKPWLISLEKDKTVQHVHATSEGEAVALSAGYHVGSGKTPLVYMQNSGLTNTINPLTSLCSKEVFSIPIMLIIGWRGEPGKNDKEQHIKMGQITLPLLDALGIRHEILDESVDELDNYLKRAKLYMDGHKSPYALIVRKDTFSDCIDLPAKNNRTLMSREDAIKEIMKKVKKEDIIVATTGKTTRELFEYRESNNQTHENDFYVVGSMGYASTIAAGIRQGIKNTCFVFDGDGAALMHMGNMATIGHLNIPNFVHIIFDNQAYESTGNQSSISKTVNFEDIASGCGYKTVSTVSTKEEIESIIKKTHKHPALYIVRIRSGSVPNLGRPTFSPIENKHLFMRRLDNVKRHRNNQPV